MAYCCIISLKGLKNSALFACLSQGPNLDYFVIFRTILNEERLTFQPSVQRASRKASLA